MVSSMDMAILFGLMVHLIREIMLMARRKALVFLLMHQKNYTKETGRMDYKMVKVVSMTKTKIL
jgi:hypothetical protein